MRVAIVYDRVNKWGGAERILLALHEMFPEAPLYTSVYNEKGAPWAKVFPKIHTSFLQKIPFARGNHEFLGTLMPLAFESFDLKGFDLIISATSEAAKGIITRPPTKHICICLTPTRYLWSHYDLYFKDTVFKGVASPFVDYLRKWDKIAAQRPDALVAISTEVQKRIKKYYSRDSTIIFPPVDVEKFEIRNSKLETNPKSQIQNPNYYLIVSRLVPYKRVDLAVEAFNRLGWPLVVVGVGRQANSLKLKAKSNIKFVGQVSEKELIEYYRSAKALIMPQEEDFGIAAVEAQAAGTPVIAYKKGGALDTVIPGKTGIFFEEQTVSGLIKTIEQFNHRVIKPDDCIKNAQRFSKEKFEGGLGKLTRNIMR